MHRRSASLTQTFCGHSPLRCPVTRPPPCIPSDQWMSTPATHVSLSLSLTTQAVFQHALQNIVTVKTPLHDCQCFSFSTPALYLTSHSESHSSSHHSISNWADVVRLFHSLDVPSVPRPFVKRQQPFMRPFRYRYMSVSPSVPQAMFLELNPSNVVPAVFKGSTYCWMGRGRYA